MFKNKIKLVHNFSMKENVSFVTTLSMLYIKKNKKNVSRIVYTLGLIFFTFKLK